MQKQDFKRSVALLCLAGVVGLGCSNPLDVENPNKVPDAELEDPTAMGALANGALATVTRALHAIGATYEAATDEIIWIGSRDAWGQLDQGRVDDPGNEFTDFAFPFVGEARYSADKAIRLGQQFLESPDIPDEERPDPDLVAQAYLAGGIIYLTIAEQFDDFVIPDEPGEAAPPVGEENMVQLFDTAIDYLTRGLALVQGQGDVNAELETRLLAVRARAHHSRAVWQLLNPPGTTPSDPLVSVPEAVADAQAVLDRVGAEWEFSLTLNPELIPPCISFADMVNQRGELQIGPAFASTDPEDPSQVTGVTLMDPIDGIPDPVIQDKLDSFLTDQFASPPVVTAREMHLIIAEDDLATGDVAGFTSRINTVRALDGLTPYSNQMPPVEMLEYERRVNLFLMFRRLADMYRFGVVDPDWSETSAAFREPGTFLPITLTEIRSNPQVGG